MEQVAFAGVLTERGDEMQIIDTKEFSQNVRLSILDTSRAASARSRRFARREGRGDRR